MHSAPKSPFIMSTLLSVELGISEQENTSQEIDMTFYDKYGYVLLKNKITALVVDDDMESQKWEKTFLECYGVETQIVENGRDAINLFAIGASFDLLIVEMALPIISGLEVTRWIRAMGAHAKIVGMTAASCEHERGAFLDAGGNEYIEKPLAPKTLIPILLSLDIL